MQLKTLYRMPVVEQQIACDISPSLPGFPLLSIEKESLRVQCIAIKDQPQPTPAPFSRALVSSLIGSSVLGDPVH